jgi:UDP-N-acetylmuramoylalanine--D-glutamate ligase
VVLEVSSYQLDALRPPGPWPRVAIVTNVSPDHLDWHGSMDAYVAAKRRIVEHQDETCDCVLNAGDPRVRAFAEGARSSVRWYSRASVRSEYGVGARDGREWLLERREGSEVRLAPVSALSVPGAFHLDNALAAAAGARAMGAEPGAIEAALAAFRGIEHRLRALPPIRGVRLFDNAVSTVPESTLSAVEAVAGPLRLVAGGKSKQLDLEPLARALAARRAAVYAYGSAAGELADACRRRGAEVLVAERLSEAFGRALADARPGDAILYSPAFPSFDQYRNFLERGREFLRLVEDARGAAGASEGDGAG